MRQSSPTGKSFLFYRICVKPRNKEYFAFPEGQISGSFCPSRPGQKGVGRRHGRWAGCGGRWFALRRWRGRAYGKGVWSWRPTQASSCRTVKSWPAVTESPRTRLRGEHDISRKAIAQGRPGVLRCPVCSCAAYLVQSAHGTAGAARTRSSLRPLFSRAGSFWQSSGAMRREKVELCLG